MQELVEHKTLGKNRYGQYFTPRPVAEFMVSLADIAPNSPILEPACGEGVFLEIFRALGFQNITAYEIDRTLSVDSTDVRHESFVSASIPQKFDLVIGNPPYIRWKNLERELKQELTHNPLWNTYCNALCDYLHIFIIKSIELLNENGQLIFICPEYWLNSTNSIGLRNYMMQRGYFQSIYHFGETPIFGGVAVSTIIFKFVKSRAKCATIQLIKYHARQRLSEAALRTIRLRQPLSDCTYLEIAQFAQHSRWVLESDTVRRTLRQLENGCAKSPQQQTGSLFCATRPNYHTLGEYCDIGNGMVSGLDRAFQLPEQPLNEWEQQSTINVVKAKDIRPYKAGETTKYIHIDTDIDEDILKERYPNFYTHFQNYKTKLEKRYQYNRKLPYWEWAFRRNLQLFSQDAARIFVPCKERITNKDYFRFALVPAGIYPTQDVTALFRKRNTCESIEYILAYLNSQSVFKWLICNGIVKGGIVEFSEKPLASIPFRPIRWGDRQEIDVHDQITALTRGYLQTEDRMVIEKIQCLFNELLAK